MSNSGAATVAAAEGEKVDGKAEMESAAAAVSEGTVKRKKTRRRKQELANDKENGAVEQEAASVAAAILEGTVKCKKKKRKQVVANAKENEVEQEAASVADAVLEGTVKSKKTRRSTKEVADAKENRTVEQEAASVAAAVLEGTVKCKKTRRSKNEVADAKENETVEQEAASVVSAVLEGTVKRKKTRRSTKEVADAKENRTVEQEAASVAAAVLEGTVKRKKTRRSKNEVADAKENGTVEQEGASVAAAVLEGTVKHKKMRRCTKEVADAKENGTVEQEAASVAAAVLEGMVKRKKMRKNKKEVGDAKENGMVEQEAASVAAAVRVSEEMPKSKEAKAKERLMMEQEATATSVCALDVTPKCKEGKAKERGVVEHGTTTSAVSAMEGATKCKEEKAKERGMAEQEANTTTVSASEGTKKRKRKKLKKKNKMQEQQESAQALSGLVVVDTLVASKPENGGTNGEGTSGDADVSMDPLNAEDPNCSKAKYANDKVKCKAQEENKSCSEKFISLLEGSEDRKRQRKRPKEKRRRDACSRSPDISSQDGGRAAKCGLDSSTDHDLGSSLVEAHKEKVKNIYSPRGSLIRFQRKKLLILDLNGLLADINMDNKNAHMAHAKVRGKLVFIRPYYYDFLRFCFQNFELGIWSSRKMENVNSVVNILMPDLKKYLLFCWDMSKCTFTGRKVIGDKHKPLVLKHLKRLWYKEDPNLPWELGEFSPSNTLLVDDSPYKALCNPPHTAIFPQPYSYLNQRDDYSLGPGGDLRVYLERLAAADDVQVFVRDNPFGQPSITESDPNWNFYAKIVNKVEAGSVEVGHRMKQKNKRKKPA